MPLKSSLTDDYCTIFTLMAAKMFRQFAILLLTSTIALSAAGAQAETLNIHFIQSEESPVNQQFQHALSRALVENNIHATIVSSLYTEQRNPNDNTKIDLNIASGAKAAEIGLADFKTPLLNIMIGKTAYDALRDKYPPRRSSKAVGVIYLDQPWDRQFNFIRAALPSYHKVGILYPPDVNLVLPRLPRGMSVSTKLVSSAETLYTSLENIMNNNDLVLAIPDEELYSGSNMRNILMTSFRLRVPLVGVSQNHINSGALCAIFSTPDQFVRQVVDTVISFAGNRQLPEQQYPETYTIIANPQTAYSLGITIDTSETIRQRMDKAVEGKR